MAAEGWREEKFTLRGRSTIKNKERGGGRGVKSSGGKGREGEKRLKKKNGRDGSDNLLEKTTSLVFHLKALIQRLKYSNK